MATPNANDNTQLGTGEQISNEAIPVTGVKLDPNLPVAVQYKVPRSKIAVGPYGQDWGDADYDYPLPTESQKERWAAELIYMQGAASAVQQQYRSSWEGKRDTVSYDPRGRLIDLRGTR
ncbi:hypothetical protein UFOVP1165_62 [uncultured Caudovirales phage]|uniref:Uncharacterized protein n=1 Tax=uncultured Caudovirales phage TaxID=2100421 RepID=A0A6J5QU77_9CAUD|nr:hypothetical protein UFOVP1165_62 [uncultured Caudovirales phage]